MTRESTAAVFHGPGIPLEIVRLPLPEPGPGEVCVRVSLCTLCGSDLHTFLGNRPAPPPLVLGHEAIGRVVELGPGAPSRDGRGNTVEIGDRITWSIAASCGECTPCRAGREPKCEDLWKYGHETCAPGEAPGGGLAEFVHLRPGTTLVRLADDLPDEVAVMSGCATATAAAALRVAEHVQDRRVLVLGAGLLGLTFAAMARRGGATDVAVVDPVAARRELARDFGAHRVLEPTALSAEPPRFDLALEASGATEAVEAAFEMLAVGGHLVLVGSVSPARAARLDPESIVRRLLRIDGVHNYRPMDLVAAVEFLEQSHRDSPFMDLIESTHPLSSAQAAFEHAVEIGGIRVAVAPDRA